MFSFGIIVEDFEVFENDIFDYKVLWMVGKGEWNSVGFHDALYEEFQSPPVCPVLLGPIMLCTLKDKASYMTLFQKMTAR